MRGLYSIIERIALGKRYSKKDLAILFSGVPFGYLKELCPFEIDIGSIFERVYMSYLKRKGILDKLFTSPLRIRARLGRDIEGFFIIPRYSARRLSHEMRAVIDWIRKLHNRETGVLEVDIRTLFYGKLAGEPLLDDLINDLRDLLSRYGVTEICVFDDISRDIMVRYIDADIKSVYELIIDYINKAGILFKRPIEGKALMILPLSQIGNDENLSVHTRIAEIIPDISITGYRFGPDIPPLYPIATSLHSKYYDYIVEESIKEGVSYLVSASIYSHDLLRRSSSGHPVIPVYYPYLIMKLSGS